ncbi:MAG: phosphoglucosamine mutase [Planctomycetota bacterium]|jgi:phosphomannomutase
MGNAADRLIVSVSGVRGIVGSSLTVEVAREFGAAFATMLGAGSSVTVARDTRPSGPELQAAITDGLLAGGVDVIDLGVVTTPGAALMTSRLDVAGGVIVTASHNPGEYNGIKFLQPTGPALKAADAERLAEIWRAKRFSTAPSPGTLSANGATHRQHVDAVCGICDEKVIATRCFKVVVDSINGAGCVVTRMLLERLGCELVHLNGEPTGQFAHKPEPVAVNLTGLCEAVRAEGAAVGFAQDPDADRLVVVDENGEFIGEEYTLALATAFVLRHRSGKVAANMVTSRMIDDVAAAAGCDVVRSPTGEANVVEAMQGGGCIFGGEGNGGVIDPRVVGVRNSLVGMAMVLQDLAETGKSVSDLVAGIPSYVMLKDKMPCPPEAAAKLTEATRAEFEAVSGARFDESDGLRVDLSDGWVSVRASNTEPIVRITTEAADRDRAEALQKQLKRLADEIVGGGVA